MSYQKKQLSVRLLEKSSIASLTCHGLKAIPSKGKQGPKSL